MCIFQLTVTANNLRTICQSSRFTLPYLNHLAVVTWTISQLSGAQIFLGFFWHQVLGLWEPLGLSTYVVLHSDSNQVLQASAMVSEKSLPLNNQQIQQGYLKKTYSCLIMTSFRRNPDFSVFTIHCSVLIKKNFVYILQHISGCISFEMCICIKSAKLWDFIEID